MELQDVLDFLNSYCKDCIDKNPLTDECLIFNKKSCICGCVIHDFKKQLEILNV